MAGEAQQKKQKWDKTGARPRFGISGAMGANIEGFKHRSAGNSLEITLYSPSH